MRTLAALFVVALLAASAVAQPDRAREDRPEPERRAESHERWTPQDQLNRTQNATRPLVPQVFLNASVEPDEGAAAGDVHVREAFVRAHLAWNLSAGAPPAAPNATVGAEPPPNRTSPPPPPPSNGSEPAITVEIDLPREANAGEALLVTVLVRVADFGRVENVTVRASVPDGFTILPSWRHDAWRGGELTFHLDEIVEDRSVYFHVLAPTEAGAGTFHATAATAAQETATERKVSVRAATDPEPGYAPREAVVLAGYAATLTAP